MADYNTISVSCADQIATITLQAANRTSRTGPHVEIGAALSALRFDNAVRVIVITGDENGFFLPPKGSPKASGHTPGLDWDLTQGMQRTYQMLLEIEKPVIAKVNGNAIGFGSSLVFACDFIVAADDAVFCDHHLGMGKTLQGGRGDFGSVPGDGGTMFVPLHMPPCIAKEYLWLSKELTGADLARSGVINAAVPRGELDERVRTMCSALLERTPHSLALAKRALNKHYLDRFNSVYDLAWSYELLNFYQLGQSPDERGVTAL
jgi:enoyl-CoA hydratase/carnithine racemase